MARDYWGVKKETVQSTISLNVFLFREKGFFTSDCNATISWANGNTIVVETHPSQLSILFKYSLNRYSGEPENINLNINLERTNCFFGGERFWFTCPNCNIRVAFLYLHQGYFICRKCAGLTYESCQKSSRGQFACMSRAMDFLMKKYEMEPKTKYYAGRPTRKFRNYLKSVAIYVDDYKKIIKESDKI